MKRIILLLTLLFALPVLATVNTLNFTASFTCSGNVGPFPFTFPINDATAMTVTVNGVLLAPSAYVVIPVNNDFNNGGNVTLNSACTNGQTLILTRVTPITQTTHFFDNMPVPMSMFEKGLDKVTEIDQELFGRTIHSIQFQNNGVNYLAPATGNLVLNFANCTVAGPQGTFSITCQGSGGGGGATQFTVPTLFPNIQLAIASSSTSGNIPVTIAPNYAPDIPDKFTNSTNLRVFDFRQTNAIDSGFKRDAKEWGVVADGQLVGPCTATSGSNVLDCPTANFDTDQDQGKVGLAVGGIGPLTGRMFGWSVVSGGTGGTNGLQPVTFTGLTCTPPYSAAAGFGQPVVYVNVVGGVPQTGPVFQQPINYGIGCTGTVPTTGTVATVTGTVAFTGGTAQRGDLPTTISVVNSQTEVVMADNAQASSSNVWFFYGSDDNDGVNNNWNAACNAMSNTGYSFGHLTFNGLSLITHGIDCRGAGIFIEGSGVEPFLGNGTGGSTIKYVGKNTGDYILNMDGGSHSGGSRFRLDGNSVALPKALQITEGVAPGNGTRGTFSDILFGADAAGDNAAGSFSVVPHLTNCIFAHAVIGNADFNTFDNIECETAKVFADTDNNQAVNWKFGKVLSMYNEIGFVAWGSEMDVTELFTETNRLDIMLGSPTCGACGNIGTLHLHIYGAESSAEQIAQSPLIFSSSLIVDDGTFATESGCGQAGTCIQSNGVSIDLSNWFGATFNYNGSLTGKLELQGGCNIQQTGINVTTTLANTIFANSIPSNCQQNFSQLQTLGISDVGSVGQKYEKLSILGSLQPITTIDETDQTYTKIYGSQDVVSPAPPSLDLGVINKGTAGAKTYNYRISCLDGSLRETTATSFSTTTGATTLNTTNYNEITWWQVRACPYINLYGDEGSGGIGLLNPAPIDTTTLLSDNTINHPNLFINDQGQFTKNTGITPLTTSNSGSIGANNMVLTGNLTVNGVCTGCGSGTITPPATLSTSALTTQDMLAFEQDTSTYSASALSMNMINGSGSFTGNFINLKENGNTVTKIDNAGFITSMGGLSLETTNGITNSTAGYKQITFGDIGAGFTYYPTSFWTTRRAPIAFTWTSTIPGGANAAGDDIGFYGVMFAPVTVGSTAAYGKTTMQMDFFTTDTNSFNAGGGAATFRSFGYADGPFIGGIDVVAQVGDATHTGFSTSSSQVAEFDINNFGIDQPTYGSPGNSVGLDVVCGGGQRCTAGIVIKDDGTHHYHNGILFQAASNSMDWAMAIPNDVKIGSYNAAGSTVLGMIVVGTGNNLVVGPDSSVTSIEYGPTGTSLIGHGSAAVCVKSDGKSLGYCSSAIGSGGLCTCN